MKSGTIGYRNKLPRPAVLVYLPNTIRSRRKRWLVSHRHNPAQATATNAVTA